MSDDILGRLATEVRARRHSDSAASYTRQLLDGGPAKCAKKVGEEATEVVIAALVEDDKRLTNEAADLVYHLVVLLEARNIAFSEVMACLESRMGTSGLAEKAARTAKP